MPHIPSPVSAVVPSRQMAVAMLCIALALLVALGARPAPAEAAVSYRWAQRSLDFARNEGFIPASQVRSPGNRVTRKAYVNALVRLEQFRAERYGAATQYDKITEGAVLSDETLTSRPAKAVKLGWISAQGGKFNGSSSITTTEASRGAVYALGLGGNSFRFARAMKANTPGLSMNFHNAANEVMARELGLRYNHLQGTETLERGPGENLTVAHVAYMVHKAAGAEQWRVSSTATLENFDLPDLGPNQKKYLYRGMKLIGQPYVWAGETTGRQPEGHGGFDCSGFLVNVYGTAGVPSGYRKPFGERTSMAQSNIPSTQRVKLANLRPGDFIFFGYKGTRSAPSDNYHAGMYMGNGWFIHSTGSNDGVSIDPLSGYWRDNFSWGRRTLKRS